MFRAYLGPIAIVIAALLIVAGAPLNAFAGHAAATKPKCKPQPAKAHRLATTNGSAVVEFGIKGGNIRPWNVVIRDNGDVEPTGPVAAGNQHLFNPTSTLNGFLRLADAEGFFTMQSVQCAGTLPDIASQYITIHTGGGAKTLTVHGGCNDNFNQLFSLLKNAAAISP
jgi:hypothetical protein